MVFLGGLRLDEVPGGQVILDFHLDELSCDFMRGPLGGRPKSFQLTFVVISAMCFVPGPFRRCISRGL